jgi:hypothetical protein
MTSDSVKPPQSRYNYPNAISGFMSLVRDEGVRGLARGLGANTVSALRFARTHWLLMIISGI